jgi:tetratricopeptide (TPR) repeat protein
VKKPIIFIQLLFVLCLNGFVLISVPSQAKLLNKFPESDNQYIELLKQSKFTELEELLKAFEVDSNSYITKELQLADAYRFIGRLNSSDDLLFEAWVKSSPNSSIAHLARGLHLYSNAGRSRGARFANEVSSAQVSKMKEELAKSIEELNKSIELNSNSSFTYAKLLSAYAFNGDQLNMTNTMQKGLEKFPHSYLIACNYAKWLMPKWYGSHEILNSYIGKFKPLYDQNPLLKNLEAIPVFAKAEELSWEKKHNEVISVLNEIIPNTSIKPPIGNVYSLRGQAKMNLNQYSSALKDLQKEAELSPYEEMNYVTLAHCYVKLKDYSLANDAIEQALLMNPSSEAALKFQADLKKYAVAANRDEKRKRRSEAAVEFLRLQNQQQMMNRYTKQYPKR